MTVAAILLHEQSDDERTSERFRVRFGAVRLDVGLAAPELTIHDVSASGFLLQTDQAFTTGSGILVELPNAICRPARIVWASNSYYGAEFAEALGPAELDRILAASPVVWPNFREEEEATEPSRRRQQPHSAERYDEAFAIENDDKLPLPQRLRFIFGTVILFWATTAAGIFLAVG